MALPSSRRHKSPKTKIPILKVKLISYGMKYGALSEEFDYNFDLSSMKASVYGSGTEKMTGADPEFRRDLLKDPEVKSRFQEVSRKMLAYLEEKIIHSDLTELVIGINCRFGKHRSVTFVEQLHEDFHRELLQGHRIRVSVKHRDLELSRKGRTAVTRGIAKEKMTEAQLRRQQEKRKTQRRKNRRERGFF